MSWQAIIDQMKDWVIDQAYATIAWVEATFLKQADVPDFSIPVSVAGSPVPDVTCTYYRCGTYGGEACYENPVLEWFIWYNTAIGWWILSETLGSMAGMLWRKPGVDVEGNYGPFGGAAGTAVVSFGHKYLLTSFVDRGDPAADDWALPFFTFDDTWRDLDLSAIVPAEAKGVLFSVIVLNSSVAKYVRFRKKGNVNIANRSQVTTQGGGILNSVDFVCPCDENRFVQYFGKAGGWAFFFLNVKGWWL